MWRFVWISLVPLIVTVCGLLILPGLLTTAASGLPLRTAAPLAPAASVAIIAGAGVVAPLVRVPWGVPLVAALTAILTLAAALARLIVSRVRARRAGSADGAATRAPTSRPSRADVLTGLVLLGFSALIMTWLVARELNTPDAISQTFDAVFHLNAVEWILRTGNASSIKCHLESPEGGVYPMGWHTLVALTMKVAHSTSIPLATNATTIAVSALVWPGGCLALASRLFNGRRLAMIATALLCTATASFPLLVISFGVLYPNFLALALLPGMIASLLDLFPAHDEPSAPPLLIPALVLAVAGLGLAQPNAIVTFLITLIILMGAWIMRAVNGAKRGGPARQIRTRIIVCAITTLATVGVWIGVRPPQRSATWGPNNVMSAVIGEILTSTPQGLPIAWVVAVPAIVGAVAAWRRRRLRWLVIFHAVGCLLYLASKTMPMGDLRYYVVGTWYSDTNRLAALIPLGAIPLAALGTCVIADRAAQRLTTLRLHEPGARRRIAYAVLVANLVLLGPASTATSQALHKLEAPYTMNAGSELLTPDELGLIRMLPGLVGEDDTVAIDPSTGAALAYSLAGTSTTIKHIFYHDTPDLEVVDKKLRLAGKDPQVCEAVNNLGIRYVLYFPGRTLHNRRPFSGFVNLPTAGGFELVAQYGRAALYRVTACG
ncbi:DUF6541 family protein [Actinomyces sp. oral taxon 448]|uniref:DUF6541 family protein n=1 Tax=Actinomyces sp. oral taxon 448 TaxID=712124 RepID=UPI0002188904|nr:hypothetical protein HMPREF9062_2306 [Actinomyces sp. oral taxon 448 str. F0400]